MMHDQVTNESSKMLSVLRPSNVPGARDVAVVICAYTEERWADLLAAVESVQRQSAPPGEIVVVIDNNRCLFKRARAQMQEVLVIENTDAPGLSGARNSGIAATTTAVVAFLDDDAAAEPNWLALLIKGYDHPNVVGVGGAILPVWRGGHPRWFPDEFNWVVGCTYRGMPTEMAAVRNLIGANMSFRREVFERVGLFQTGVGQVGGGMLRCDDTEFCIRVLQRWPGSAMCYNPTLRVRHMVPASRGRWSYFKTRCYTEGLAKVLISRIAGARDGLSSERAYTFRTLPLGVLRGLGDAVLRGDVSGLGRAAAIIAGLALTTTGFLVGTLDQRFSIQAMASRARRMFRSLHRSS